MDNMSISWVTVSEAATALNVSDKTIRRRVKQGKLEAKLEGRRLLVKSDKDLDTVTDSVSKDEVIADLRAQLDDLRHNIQDKDRQIENLQTQLAEASQRHDTVVMQITKMLEYERQPFWRRWISRKALPAPGDVVDVGTGVEERPDRDE